MIAAAEIVGAVLITQCGLPATGCSARRQLTAQQWGVALLSALRAPGGWEIAKWIARRATADRQPQPEPVETAPAAAPAS